MGQKTFNAIITTFLIVWVCSAAGAQDRDRDEKRSERSGQPKEQSIDSQKPSENESGSFANWFSRPVAAENPCSLPPEPGPGPLKKLRGELYGQIKTAKKRGVGIDPYLKWCTELEAMAAAGKPEEKVREKLFFILNQLHSQMNRGARIRNDLRAGGPNRPGWGILGEDRVPVHLKPK
ncbi:MAG: hypothetical protein IPM23_05905 [Candidatus Melainabacteria bacterium]|nr:hypothetical protein [Candidatus Melainabacteria bacterium]